MVLGLADRAGARNLAESVSDPSSDSYGDFVSAAEFRRRFSYRRVELRPVVSWLRSHGFSVARPTRNRDVLPVSGTAAQFEEAFGSRLRTYDAYGQELIAPRAKLEVPRRLSGLIEGTVGIPEEPLSPDFVGAGSDPGAEDLARAAGAGGTTDPGPPPLGFDGLVGEQPKEYCSNFWAAKFADGLPKAYGQSPLLAICGYSAKQIRSAYGAQKLYRKGTDGSGIDIGIVTAYVSPTLQDDLDGYSEENKIPNTRLRITRPPSYTPTSAENIWDSYTEQTLDVQVSHGMAPGARIHYSGPDSLAKAVQANAELIDRNKVDLISNSWGGAESGTTRSYFRFAEDTFMQAAAQGITMLFSSGDQGDGIDSFGIRTVQYPSSSPWVTGSVARP